MIEIRIIGSFIAIDNREKSRDCPSSSNNPVVSDNRRSDNRDLTVLRSQFIYNFGLMGPGTPCFPYQWVQLQTFESRKLFFMTSLQFHCILGLAEIKTLHPRDKIMSKRCRMRR